jgi:Na+-transporting NADH:ubiquinone oxidoreductase subunit B
VAQQTPKLLKKQDVMRKVMLALTPCIAGSVYFFGWRALAVIAVSCLTAFVSEFIMARMRGEPVTEAVFVTGILFGLILPPTVPWHVVVIGSAFGVIFSKEVFGGFGRNVFNPALAGRCFVYICFPRPMTTMWAEPASLPLGGLMRWCTYTVDSITAATPMIEMKLKGVVPQLSGLFTGHISGVLGATSVILILLGGIYLYGKKIANRQTILSLVITYALINEGLRWAGVPQFHGALPAVLGGGFLFGAFFMATDPVSSPKTKEGRIFYGILIASCAAVIRNFSIFNGGLMFSILLGNMFAPIIDYGVNEYKSKKKAKGAAK